MVQNQQKYSLEQRWKILMEMETSALTLTEMATKTGVPDSTLDGWIKDKDRIKSAVETKARRKELNLQWVGPIPSQMANYKRALAEEEYMYLNLFVPMRDKLANEIASGDIDIDKGCRSLLNLVNIMVSQQKKRRDIIESIQLLKKVEEASAQQQVTVEQMRRDKELQKMAEMALIAWAKGKAERGERVTQAMFLESPQTPIKV